MPGPHRRSRTQLPGVPYDLGVDKDFDDLWKTVRRLDARVQTVEGGKVTTVTHERTVITDYELDAKFVVVEADSRLSNAQVLTGTANQVTVAANTATLSLPQNIHTTATPTFGGLTLTGLTGVLQATAGVVSGSAAHSALASIGANDHHDAVTLGVGSDPSLTLVGQVLTLAAPGASAPVDAQYVTLALNATLTSERVLTGTANQITVTDGGAGTTVTLSTPQDIATASTPTFAGLSLGVGGLNTVGTITPAADSTYNLGTSGPLYWANVYADNFWVLAAQGMTTTGTNLQLKFGANDYLELRSGICYWYIGSGFRMAFTTTGFYPYTDSAFTCGSSSRYWSNTYTDALTLNSTAVWSGASAGVLAGTGAMTLTGLITNYNSVATEGYGVPAIVDNVALTGQTGSIGSTNFTNAGTAGEYRISYYMFCTTLGAGNELVQLTFAWNDGTSAKTQTSSSMALHTGYAFTQGVIYLRLGSGSVSFSSTFAAGLGSPQYAVYLSCERMN